MNWLMAVGRIPDRLLSWIILWLTVISLYPIIVLCLEVNHSKSQTDSKLVLRNCCLPVDNSSDISSEANCTEKLAVNWGILKKFRVPRNNLTGLSDVNRNISSIDKLECESSLEFTIPAASLKQGEDNPVQGFFTFFSNNGHFQYNEQVYSSDEYCIQRITPEAISVLACDQTAFCLDINNTHRIPCLRRCCNYGELWDISGPRLRCTDSGAFKWTPKLHKDIYSRVPYTSRQEKIVVLSTHPRELLKKGCKLVNHSFQSPSPELHHPGSKVKVGKRPFRVLKDGTVWMKLRKREWVKLDSEQYCIDGFQNGTGNYSGNNENSLLFECKAFETKENLENKELQRKFSLTFGVILMICLCFLMLTTIVYILLWSKHNYHGWTVFSYIVALDLTYLMLGVSHFASLTMVRKTNDRSGIWSACGVIGVLCHFAFLSAFSWSTVLNFDLWCTFRSLKPASGNKSSGLKKFFIYSVFAFLVPTSVVSVGVVLDIMYRHDVFSDIITPEYGRIMCYVEPRYARFYFVVLPMAVLLGINLFLFCNTTYAVYKLKKSTQFASASSTKKEASNQTFRLILKLLLINGIIWIFEIVSWYIQKDYEAVGIFSFVVNVVNVMQAVAIFFLFVFKNDILDSLKRMYPCLEGIVDFTLKLKNLGRDSQTSENTRESTAASCEQNSSKANTNIQMSQL